MTVLAWVMLLAGLAIGGVLGYLLGHAEGKAYAAHNQAQASVAAEEKAIDTAAEQKASIDKQAADVMQQIPTDDPATVVDKLEHLRRDP